MDDKRWLEERESGRARRAFMRRRERDRARKLAEAMGKEAAPQAAPQAKAAQGKAAAPGAAALALAEAAESGEGGDHVRAGGGASGASSDGGELPPPQEPPIRSRTPVPRSLRLAMVASWSSPLHSERPARRPHWLITTL